MDVTLVLSCTMYSTSRTLQVAPAAQERWLCSIDSNNSNDSTVYCSNVYRLSFLAYDDVVEMMMRSVEPPCNFSISVEETPGGWRETDG